MEPALTIVAASIPVLRHLFKAFRRTSSDDLDNTHTTAITTTTTYTPSPTTSANMQNLVDGGTRASRLAAARAEHHSRVGGSHYHGGGDSDQVEKEKREMAQVGGLGLGRPPGFGGGNSDGRSERGMAAARHAELGSSSTCTSGGSEWGSAPLGEKRG
jgi:hypothetical protein